MNWKRALLVSIPVIILLISTLIYSPAIEDLFGSGGGPDREFAVYEYDGRTWLPGDRSILRGYSEEEMVERIMGVVGASDIENVTVFFQYDNLEERDYEFDNGVSLEVHVKDIEGVPVDHRLEISFPRDGIPLLEGYTKGIHNQSILFTRRMLVAFGYRSVEDLHFEYDYERSTYGREALNIYQIWNGEPFEYPGIRTRTLNRTGMLKSICLENWVFIDEVREPVVSFDRIRDRLMEDIESVNNTFEVHVQVMKGHSSYGWTDEVIYPVETNEIFPYGHSILLGRICHVVGLKFNVTGNFSNRFPDAYVVADDEQHFSFTWFYDVESGTLLRYSRYGMDGAAGTTYFGNLIGKGSSWKD